ncbi:MAG: hypothetical protein V4477_15560 [Pseudomonadota bacterium]
MPIKLPLTVRVSKSIFIATIVLFPTVSLSQDFGGIAGALIHGAINAQRQQQYQNQQRRPRHRSNENDEAVSRVEKNKKSDGKKAEAQQEREAFLKIVPAVKDLIEDASTFVKQNPTNPKLVTFVKKISGLNSALAAENLPKLKPLMEDLVGDLRHEPGYEKLEAARSEQKRMEAARYLPELTKTAKQQQAFIRYYITNNPTAQSTSAFIPLLDAFDQNLKSPDLEKLKALTSKVDVSIREASLQDDFVKSKNVLVDQAAQPTEQQDQLKSPDQGLSKSAKNTIDENVLRKTAKNAFLVDGDPRDFVFLYNSSPQAPHLTKNLSGGVVFENDQAAACLYEPNYDSAQSALLRQRLLSKYGLQKLSIDASECPRNRLSAYDIVAVERGRFLQFSPEIKIALYAEIENGYFRHLETVTAEQLAAYMADKKKAQNKIIADIENGSGGGYGIVYGRTAVSAICLVIKDMESGHRQLLQDKVELTTAEITLKPTLDDAFKTFQRDGCQAIYSSSVTLKTLVTALKNDNTEYSISPLWNSDEEIQQADNTAQNKKEVAEKERVIRENKRKADEDLRRTTSAERSATARSQQEALQSQFGKIAAATSAAIAQDVRDSTDGRADWQQGKAYAAFPKFVVSYQNMLRNHWELQSFNSEISDYGRAVWQGRTMEAGFSIINIRLRNRILGEYTDVCRIFGQLNDAEFNMQRDPVEMSCDQAAQLTSWKKARDFQSQWLVQPRS